MIFTVTEAEKTPPPNLPPPTAGREKDPIFKAQPHHFSQLSGGPEPDPNYPFGPQQSFDYPLGHTLRAAAFPTQYRFSTGLWAHHKQSSPPFGSFYSMRTCIALERENGEGLFSIERTTEREREFKSPPSKSDIDSLEAEIWHPTKKFFDAMRSANSGKHNKLPAKFD
ncbi:NADH-quinone oxidoreductase subunit D [Striga asiatica]|uniref:NADH-quinone oxidoreductase subunit D n=1 Tax=Striga asiatica TaxID=4170 RepID=A0A5A7P8Y4_STRAF|nr:NADH-quinone oxidoreductase subunit D [Striga asiatica]